MVRKTWCLAVSVTVVLLGTTTSSARSRAVQPPAFERVLMPFVGEGSVANQYWLSQFWAKNESDTPIPVFFPYPCQLGEGCSPNRPGELVAHGLLFINPTNRGASGVFLNIGRGRLRDLAYTLRVEDVSGLDVAFVTLGGTELPLVPEDRFSPTVTLLNIPASSGTLKLLRVYGWTGEPANVTVRIYSSQDNADVLLRTQTLALQAGATESGFEAYPAFGTVDLTSTITTLASQATQGRLNIEITADSGHQIWSFLALLQQGDRSFTAITPGR